jgi:hypothetical protein
MTGRSLEERGIYTDIVLESFSKSLSSIEGRGQNLFTIVDAVSVLKWLENACQNHSQNWMTPEILAITIANAGIYLPQYRGGDYTSEANNVRTTVNNINLELEDAKLHLRYRHAFRGSYKDSSLPGYRILNSF